MVVKFGIITFNTHFVGSYQSLHPVCEAPVGRDYSGKVEEIKENFPTLPLTCESGEPRRQLSCQLRPSQPPPG